MDEKEQNENKTDESKTSSSTQDPESSQPKEIAGLPLRKNASVASSETEGSPKTDSGLVTTSVPTPDRSGSTPENSGNIVESGVSLPSLKTTPSGGSSSPAADKSDKTLPSDENDPKVLLAVKTLPTGDPQAKNLPVEEIEMQEFDKPAAPGENPATDEGVDPASCPHPDSNVPDEDAYGSSGGCDFGCMAIVLLLCLAFFFAALSPVIGLLVSSLNNNGTDASNETDVTNGTNATNSNDTFDNASFAGKTSLFFTTELYDVSSSNRT